MKTAKLVIRTSRSAKRLIFVSRDCWPHGSVIAGWKLINWNEREMMSAQTKLLSRGRKRISISETGHGLQVVERGSAVGKEIIHDVENRLLNCLSFSTVQIMAIWRWNAVHEVPIFQQNSGQEGRVHWYTIKYLRNTAWATNWPSEVSFSPGKNVLILKPFRTVVVSTQPHLKWDKSARTWRWPLTSR